MYSYVNIQYATGILSF